MIKTKQNITLKYNMCPDFNSCADVFIEHPSDNFIYYDNLIDIGLDTRNNPCYIETDLTKKERFSFNNKDYFIAHILDLPLDVLFEPIETFLSIVVAYISEGFVFRVSDEDENNIVIFDSYDAKKKELFGKKYSQLKTTKEISVKCKDFKDFLNDNSFVEKMYFFKRKEKIPNVSTLRMKIQMEYYILKKRNINANLGINVLKKLNYRNKKNKIFFLEHKLLMINRIEHLINYKGMCLDENTNKIYKQYVGLVNLLVNNVVDNVDHKIVLKILALEEQVIKYISEYYKEHD